MLQSNTVTLTQHHDYPVALQSDVRCARQLPSALVDFIAMALCEIIPIQRNRRKPTSPPLPELVYFILKTTYQAQIQYRTAVIALIYLDRAKENLPLHAVGNDDTCHRLLLGALLLASKFLQDSTWQPENLTNRRLQSIWFNIYTLKDIADVERSFLKLIQFRCWVDEKDINDFVRQHRADLGI